MSTLSDLPATVWFELVLADGSTQVVDGADAYQQEQSMTTFFRTDRGRQTVDSWSVRVASFRTDAILAIRRRDTAPTQPPGEAVRVPVGVTPSRPRRWG